MPDMLSKSAIVAGNVELFANRKWKQRYCIISRSSNFSTHLKLYVFKSQAQSEAAVNGSSVEPLDSVHGSSTSTVRNGKVTTNSIVLTCDSSIVILAFGSIQDFMAWNEAIKRNLSDVDFRVRLVKTEGCRLQSGTDGRLHVQKTRLCFYSEPAEACRQLHVWNLSCVRKYFVDADKNFVFESRANCDKANGLHHFQSDQADRIILCTHAVCCNKPLLPLRSGESVSPPNQPVLSNPYVPEAAPLSTSHPSQYLYHRIEQQQQQQPPHHQPVARRRRDRETPAEEDDQTVFTFEPPDAEAGGGRDSRDYCNLRDRTSYLSMSDVHPYEMRAGVGRRLTGDYVRMASGGSPDSGDEVDGRREAAESESGASPATSDNQYDEVAVDSPPQSPVGSPGCSTVAAAAASPPELHQQPQLQQRRPKPHVTPLLLQRPAFARSQSEGPAHHHGDAAAEAEAAAAADAELRSPTMRTRPQAAVAASCAVGGHSATLARVCKPRHGGEYVSRERLQSTSSETGGGGGVAGSSTTRQSPPLPQPAPTGRPAHQPAALVSRSLDYVNLRPSGGPATVSEPPPRMQYAQLLHPDSQGYPGGGPAAAPAPLSMAAIQQQQQQLLQQQQQQQHLLNYTEVDHKKTRAFQEIAVEEESRRNPASRSASSASVNGAKQRGVVKMR